MSDSPTLDRYLATNETQATSGGEQERGPEDIGTFGWLRGIRDRAVMLELRRKDGSIRAVGYAWLEQVDLDPSGTITLSVAGQKIRLKGRNLNVEVRPAVRLFEGLTRHRVPWVREADRAAAMQAGPAETVIEAIEW